MNRILVANCTKPSLDIELKTTGFVFFKSQHYQGNYCLVYFIQDRAKISVQFKDRMT